jgi:peptide/nickel transport system permease protein
MLDTIHQDYLATARAKGLRRTYVLVRHALPNAILPLITLAALDVPALFSGAVIAETIFRWPGMGQLGVTAAFARDYTVLMGLGVISATLVVLSSLLADILYAVLDPRIRYD